MSSVILEDIVYCPLKILPHFMFSPKLHVLLADDDSDDCLFFKEALEELNIAAMLTTVHNGVQLMHHLEQRSSTPPDVLFLDLNMPLRNGYDCLTEIKSHEQFKHLPVVIYSTCYDETIADRLFDEGAYFYIRKPAAFVNLKKVILQCLTALSGTRQKPPKEEFMITSID